MQRPQARREYLIGLSLVAGSAVAGSTGAFTHVPWEWTFGPPCSGAAPLLAESLTSRVMIGLRNQWRLRRFCGSQSQWVCPVRNHIELGYEVAQELTFGATPMAGRLAAHGRTKPKRCLPVEDRSSFPRELSGAAAP